MTPRSRHLLARAWAVQPAYLVWEVAVAARATQQGSYGVVADSVSALAVACGTGSDGAAGAASLGACSPWHASMNVAFALFGVLVVLGAPLVRRHGPSTRDTVAASLWVLAGLSSVGVALAPLDSHPTLHVVVATPVFVAQPLAIALSSLPRDCVPRRVGLVTAAVCAAAALAFVLGVGGDGVSGALERLALWPVKIWLGATGVRALLHRAREHRS